MNVKTFDDERLKILRDEADPYLLLYIKALERNAKGWKDISRKAIKKLKEVTSEAG